MATLVDLGFTINTSGIRAGERELGRLSQAGANADRSLAGASNSARLLNQALAAGAGLLAGKKIIDYADAWKMLNAQVRQVTDSEETLISTRSKLVALSSQTRTSLESTVGLYSNLTRATESLGLSQLEVMDITKTINNLFLAGGKNGAAAAAGITQLSQAFASGVLRGDEFNSVAENAPRILDALGQKLGKTRGELRAMAEAGLLSSQALSEALIEYGDTAQKLANTTEKLFSQSIGSASDNVLQFVGTSKALNDSINALGAGLESVTANMDMMADAATVLAVVIGAKMVAAGARNAASTALQIQANTVRIQSEQSLALGIERRAAIEAIAAKSAMTAAQSQNAAALATMNSVRANGTATQSVAILIEAENALILTQNRLSAATIMSAEATLAAAAATARLTVANEAAAATGLLATATRGAASALALVGGPVGLAIIAAAGIYYFMTKASDASEELKKFNGTLDETADKFKAMGEYGQKNTINTFTQGIKEARQEIANLEKEKAKAERGTYIQGATGKIVDEAEVVRLGEQLEIANKKAASLQDTLSLISKIGTPDYQAEIAALAVIEKQTTAISKTLLNLGDSKVFTEKSEEIEKEIALFGTVGKAAEIAYDLAHGKLNELKDGEGERLVSLQKTLDAQIAAAEKQSEIDDELKKKAEDIAAAEKARQEGIDSTLKGLSDEYNQLVMTKEAYLAYTLAAQGATKAEIDAALRMRKNNEDLVANKKATEDTSAAIKEHIKSVEDLGGSWSRTGSVMVDAFGSMTDALDDYSARQDDLVKKEKANQELKAKTTDPKELAALGVAEKKLADDRTKANINGYAKMSGAAAKMFSEQSKGRKALNNAEKVFTAVEIALSLQKASANALAAITSAFAAPFPINFAAGAAMIGIMSGLGLFGGGGSGGAPDVAEMQKNQGTGSVLGSSDKSESIANSLERFEDVGIDQLAELRGIRSAMTSLSNGIANLAVSLVTGGNVSGKNVSGLGSSQAVSVGGSLSKIGFGSAFNAVMGGIFGTTKKSLEDTGLSFEAQELGDIFSGNLDAAYYNTIKTTKKNLFGKKTSFSDELTAIESGVGTEFTRIFDFLGETVQQSVVALGVTTNSALSDFVVDIGKISFKDLSGEEIQAQLEAVFSKQGDLIAEFMLPQITKYQQMGEGAFETLTRVAQEQVVFNDALKVMGMSLGDMSNLLRIDVAQSLIETMGGLEEFSSKTASYIDKFFDSQTKMDMLTKSMSDVFDSIGVTMPTARDGFKSLVESLDLTNESGRQLFSTLMEVAPSFDQYISNVEKLHKAELDYWVKIEATAFEQNLQIMEKTGQATEALAIRRARELAAMDPLLRSNQLQIWALDDLAAASKKAADALAKTNTELKALDDAAYQAMLGNLNAQKDAIEKAQSSSQEMLSKSFDTEKEKIQSGLDIRLSALDAQFEAESSILSAKNDEVVAGIEAKGNAEMAALQAQKEATGAWAKSLRSASDEIKSAYAEMSGGMGAGEAQNNILSALAKAWRGDFSGAVNLGSSLDAVKGGTFSSAAEERIFNARTVYALDSLGSLTGNAATIAERTLAQMESSESAAKERHESAINSAKSTGEASENSANARHQAAIEAAKFEAEIQIAALDAQLNSLLGIDNSVLPLNEAILNFKAAQDAAAAFDYEAQVASLDVARSQLGELARINEQLAKYVPAQTADKTAETMQQLSNDNKKMADNMASELASIRRNTSATANSLLSVELDGMKTRAA